MKLNKLSKKYLKKQAIGYVSKDQTNKDLSKYLRLDLGENLRGCNPKIINVLKKYNYKDLIHYADPSSSSIKNKLANLYRVKTENVTIANSSNEIIDYLPRLIINPGEKVLIITPTFFRFAESTLLGGGKIIYLSLKEEEGFELTENILKRIVNIINKNNIKLVWLCNPNNPTGAVITLDFIKIILKTKTFIVLDEAFYEFFDLTNKYSGIRFINKNENLIVIRTLSKAYGLAGLRLGYALAHKNTIKTIEETRNTLLMTSKFTQDLALSVLDHKKWLEEIVKKTLKQRNKLINQLVKNKNLMISSNSRTNVFLLKHKKKDIFQELKNRGILTADFRQSKGLKGKKYVRVTIGSEKDNQFLQTAIKNI